MSMIDFLYPSIEAWDCLPEDTKDKIRTLRRDVMHAKLLREQAKRHRLNKRDRKVQAEASK